MINPVKKATDATCSASSRFPSTDGSGYEVAASHAYHEGQRLDNCHGREDNAYGTRSTGSQLAYEKRIGHVVNRSYQHADDGRNCQFRNDPIDRGVGHLIVLVVLGSCIFSQIKHLDFLFVKNAIYSKKYMIKYSKNVVIELLC